MIPPILLPQKLYLAIIGNHKISSITEIWQNLFNGIESGMGSYYQDIFSQIAEDKRDQVIESLNLLLDAVDKSNCCGGNNCC